ncbi:hypothetical protein R1T16_11435 [Flavobacterium sp. DG1-102-2]|uniref:hypothetical protein n=1 Tax=Flavobacterium sp. DG1-102-2 TaxID=3081663 RepID=UPI00294A8E18|nr:hypothetical protein [Flavobacterium sp. DG1-102-2]MDV6169042.1 hypothetical protein [Flavobacterium sp. DG1-102-2]
MTVTEILNLLLRSVFIGFGFLIPLFAVMRTSDLKKLEFKDLFILTAVQLVRISGILYFVLAAVAAYPLFFSTGPAAAGAVKVDLSGFGMQIIIAPVITLLITQFFWFKKLYMKRKALIVLPLLLLIIPSALFIKIAQSQDFAPVLKAAFSWQEIVKAIISIIIFFFITFTIVLLGGKLKDKKA